MTDVKLNGAESIPEVIAAMTLEEKARLVAGAGAFSTYGIERLGIPMVVPLDGHNGLNMTQYLAIASDRALARMGHGSQGLAFLFGLMQGADLGEMSEVPRRLLNPEYIAGLPEAQRGFIEAMADEFRALLPEEGLPTCFPPGITMASTWDPDLVGECAAAVANEAKAFGVGMVLGPNVNIHRNPLGGRIFESYGEDPYLAGRIAVGYIRGMQAEGVAADVKHFAANNQETNRQRIDEHIPERALREIYLPAFRAAVQEGDVWTVMSAYNKINGVDCALNRWLLTDLLRGEWGFDGLVVSDWGAAYDRIEALLAGNDLEMPGPQDPQVVIDAVNDGRLPEAVLDERVANILGVWVKIPAFNEARPRLDRPASVRMATAIAREGAVLLKNEGGVLPITRKGVIAVVGHNAVHPYTTGGGSAGVTSPYVVSLFEGLDARYGHNAVSYGDIPDDAVAVVVAAGVNSSEGADRVTWDLPGSEVGLIRNTATRCKAMGIPCIVVLNVCGPVEMASWVDKVDAVLLLWLGGQELGHAAAALIAGDANPSGKLVSTWPKRYMDVPSALNFPGEGGEVWYGEGLYVGYRYYDKMGIEPLYPFGYGLSYTSFALSNLVLSVPEMNTDREETMTISVDVRNTGRVAGQEVVQFYIADAESMLDRPPKELKAFHKVAVAPGQTETVTVTLDRRALEHWEPTEQAWVVEPGVFRVLVGTSAADTPLEAEFTVTCQNPYAFGPKTTMGRLVANQQAAEAVMAILLAETGGMPSGVAMASMLSPLRAVGDVVVEVLAVMLPEATDERRGAVAQQIWDALAIIVV